MAEGTTQLHMSNGTYWHVDRPFDYLWDAVENSTWLELPLVVESHRGSPHTVAINVAHIASMRPMSND